MKRLVIILWAMSWVIAMLAQDTKPQETKSQESKPAETKIATNKKIAPNSKVFLAPMGGFESDLKTAIETKKVPIVLVADKDHADYVITGTSETEKAGAAKKVIMLNWHSNEQASITATNHTTPNRTFPHPTPH